MGLGRPAPDAGRLAAGWSPAAACANASRVDDRAATVLVVDDDADAREALAASLDGVGMRAVLARDGGEALALLRGGLRPRAILLDLMMPNVNGREFLEAVRDDPELRELPVFTMSGGEVSTPRGVRRHLLKPFEIASVLRLVRGLRR